MASEWKDKKELVLQRGVGRAFQQNLWARRGNLCCCPVFWVPSFLSNEGAVVLMMSLSNEKTKTI